MKWVYAFKGLYRVNIYYGLSSRHTVHVPLLNDRRAKIIKQRRMLCYKCKDIVKQYNANTVLFDRYFVHNYTYGSILPYHFTIDSFRCENCVIFNLLSVANVHPNSNNVFAENCYFIFFLSVNVYNATARNESYNNAKQCYTSTFPLVFFIFETYITWREVFNEY